VEWIIRLPVFHIEENRVCGSRENAFAGVRHLVVVVSLDFIPKILGSENVIHYQLGVMSYMPIQMHINTPIIRQ
jgi:hypothetical protein